MQNTMFFVTCFRVTLNGINMQRNNVTNAHDVWSTQIDFATVGVSRSAFLFFDAYFSALASWLIWNPLQEAVAKGASVYHQNLN